MTARGDSLGCSRNPGSNYYAGLTHQLMIDLDADDAAKVSAFHSQWVAKAGGKLLRSNPPLFRRIGTFGLAVGADCAFSLGIAV